MKHRNVRVGILLWAFMCGFSARGLAAPQLPGTSIPYYVNAFEEVWKTVRDKFWDKKLNGVDWNQIGETYRTRLGTVKTKAEFESLINAMLLELHASHAEYTTDEDFGYYMFPAVLSGDFDKHRVAHIGIMGEAAASGFRVTGVLDGGPGEKAGLRAGDIILAADDKPFTTAGSCRGREGQEIRLKIQREDIAAPLELKAIPVRENPLTAFLNATRKSARTIDVGGRRLGYVHLWTMANDRFNQLLTRLVLNDLASTDGLILDIRDGYGGTPFGYLDVFQTPDIVWEQTGRDGTFSHHTGYAHPMVLLTNGGTRSAKEYFTLQFKKSKRAVVIGTRTRGAFLGASGFPIAQDGFLELPVVGLRLSGERLEGVGVPPDIEVPARHTYMAQDAQRLRAEQFLVAALHDLPAHPKQEHDTVVH